MKAILHNELYDFGVFTNNLPTLITKVIKVNTFNIPYRMKALIAMSEVISFASQFKRNIQLPDDTIVPINAINFCIAPSGANKDSSLRATRRVFSKAYELIEAKREEYAVANAIELATAAGEEMADTPEVYKPYYTKPSAIFLKDLTPQGLIQYMNDVSKEPLGSGIMVNSEVADEFNSNQFFPDIIKVLSEAYDLGIVEASYTKSKENRNNGVSGVPFNAMFIGSYYMLMYNQQLKAKFIASFMSKLSRRCSFTYIPDKIEDPIYSTGADLIKAEQLLRDTSKAAADTLIPEILAITNHNIKLAGHTITLSPEADTIMLLLKRYDAEIALTECVTESADNLYRKNRYWRALKLAGALAIMDKQNVVSKEHFIQAINLTELFAMDMATFEYDLNKSDHERFSDYVKAQTINGSTVSVNVHELKKQGFVATTTKAKLQELVLLASGYDNSGVYYIANDNSSIIYEPIMKTSVATISYKPIDTKALNKAIESNDAEALRAAKHIISANAANGFESAEIDFSELRDLLEGDYAYSPFRFRNGVRSRDNVIGGAKFLVLDIDSSPISASEAHFMLSDLNHHIALSSDPSNEFKFRVILELDSSVELSPLAWKHFYLQVAADLGIKVDPVPQSQIFFSYAGRPILSQLSGTPLETRQYIMQAKEREAERANTISTITSAQAKAQLADPESTFAYAFHSPWGSASRNIYRMMQHAKDLGATLEQTQQLICDVNEYYEVPFEPARLDALLEQCRRLF